MNVPMRTLTLCAASMFTLSACATKGYVNKRVDAQAVMQTAALDSERTARVQGDEANKAEIASLRNDLQTLRTEFGAKITEVSQGLQFAFPVHFAFNDATVRTEDAAALDRFDRVRDHGAQEDIQTPHRRAFSGCRNVEFGRRTLAR